jgi:hypothetical protein
MWITTPLEANRIDAIAFYKLDGSMALSLARESLAIELRLGFR